MEHIIFYHIMSFFTSQNILNPQQHGFRPNHSCQTQLIDFIDEIQRSMNARQQTDLLFMDFSKAFDTIPHRRLLNKLQFYGVQGPVLHWISSWLHQRVIVDGESSSATSAKSGVLQGMILGPLMFLVFIYDINESITSSVRLFADDCVVYRTITMSQYSEQLQEYLHQICKWTIKWQMKINVDKCAVLCCTRYLTPIQYVYQLLGHFLDVKKLHTYLGIGIDNTMSWSSLVQTISNRSTKVLNFIKRNLYNCPPNTKRIAYLTLVRPIMEYASSVWDPYYTTDICKLEKVQKRAVRWILSDYSRTASVTSMLSSLNISTLQQHRKSSRLTLFYQIINNTLPISIPSCYQRTHSFTRQYHQNHFILPHATLNTYKYSFYPRTIKEWNNLSINVTESRDINKFTFLT